MADERIALLLDMGVSKENVQAVVQQLDALEGKARSAAGAADALAGSSDRAASSTASGRPA
jgi:hypothetical protein